MSFPAPDWSNARLVESCARGDERAWGVLVDRYKNLVYSIALKYGAPHHEAADIFQSVWLDLFHELPRLRDAEALQGWLVRVTTHKCYHWKRRQSGEEGSDEALESLADNGHAASGLLAEAEREQMVRDAIGELPPRCREILDMLFFEHPPVRYAEVARRLRLAPGSIGFIRGRCLKRLKDILETRGF
jgi:RNA polymerase sigma factor (sigma-70 family)